jgi:uncharacterized membrane protein
VSFREQPSLPGEPSVGDESEPDERAIAWGVRASHSEPRWPAALTVAAALVIYLTLPPNLHLGPRLLIPVLEALILLPLMITRPLRHHDESRPARAAAIALTSLVTVANLVSLVQLVLGLIDGDLHLPGRSLIEAAVGIWITNVLVFALWYWELDRGGPAARSRPSGHRRPDFLFVQMATIGTAPTSWTPSFVDYLYVSFTNCTAFSPTDTMPLTPAAKLLMLVQALVSFVTVAVVAARAINILL